MKLLYAILLTAFLSVGAFAETTGSLRGEIKDPRGYIMYGLTVVARPQATGSAGQAAADVEEPKAIADKEGKFFFENLEPGRYILIAKAQNIELILGQVTIEAGKTSETELLALETRPTGNVAVDKMIASMEINDGAYPAGNISYLNLNDSLDNYLMIIYFGILGLLSCYGIYRYRMIYLFLRYKKHPPHPKARFDADRLPRITVQLPLYNEMYVSERLIEAVTKIDYPRELLEIQVLDDSTDDTVEIAQRSVKKFFDQGFDIVYHHRTNRAGFKAGALEGV
jgi:hypothetical protein